MPSYFGKIEKGTGRATKLGFPTMNIPFSDKNISGIYAARVAADGISYNAAVYADKRRKILEAHIIDFNGIPADCEITVELLEKLRDDKFFDNNNELRAAIADDIRKTRRYFDRQ